MSQPEVSKKIIFISGPTASGKTDFSHKISKELGEKVSFEIINADTRQFFKEISVGVAKPEWLLSREKYHLFEILEPSETLSSEKYKKLVEKKIREVWSRGAVP